MDNDRFERVQIETPSRGGGRSTPRSSSNNAKPSKQKIKDLVEGLLISENMAVMQWAGIDPYRNLFVLTEQEIKDETEAITELLMSYPGLYSYLNRVENGGPLIQFILAQITLLSVRMKKWRALDEARIEAR